MNNKKLTIIARLFAKEGKKDIVKSKLLSIIDIVKNEKGCVDFDLHQDIQNENLFLFYENWESRELWQEHMNNAHSAEFNKAIEDIVDEVILNEMIHIA